MMPATLEIQDLTVSTTSTISLDTITEAPHNRKESAEPEKPTMGDEDKTERIEVGECLPEKPSGQENESKLFPQIQAIFIVNLTVLAAGMAYAWITPSLPLLRSPSSDLHMNNDQEGWVAAALHIGAIIGPFISALLLNYIGRKWFLYITSVPFIICWALTFLATSWVELFVGRFIAGLSIGSLWAIVPVYLSEVVETKIRGAASAMIPAFLNIGSLIVYAVGPLVDRKMLAIICAAPTIVFVLTCFWLPESPYYYLKKGDKKRAELSLIWLRSTKDSQEELTEMKKLIDMEGKTSVKDLFVNKTNGKSFLVLLMLLTGQQVSGYIAVQSYSGLLFKKLPTPIDYNNILILIGVLSLISSVTVASLVDKFGRRPLYLSSGYLSSLCLIVIGTYFLLDQMKMHIDNYIMVPAVVIIVYFLICSIGLLSIPSIVSSEIFPIGVKSWATMFANSYGAILAMIVTKCYPLLVDMWGYHFAFYAFAILELLFSTIAAVYLPETSKKSFINIQNMLKVTPETKEKTEEGQ